MDQHKPSAKSPPERPESHNAKSADVQLPLVDLSHPDALRTMRDVRLSQMHALAQAEPVPSTVADWAVKHSALKDKASKTESTLQFFGDSITEYMGNGDPANLNAFQRNFPSLKSANFGIAGDTSIGLFKRINDGELGGHPKALVMMIGTNDIPTSKSADEIAQNVANIVKTVRLSEPDTKILIMGLLPRCAPDDPAKTVDMAKIKQVNAEISHLANGKTIRFLDIGDKFKDAKGNARQDLLPDYLHPNYAGYEVWSNAIKPVIESMTR
ncbi:MAG TPA: GDSL-type esterase/lipase family protein [Oculatellaceae cyanobacterium]